MNTVSDRVVRHSLAYLSVQKIRRPLVRKNMAETDHPLKDADF